MIIRLIERIIPSGDVPDTAVRNGHMKHISLMDLRHHLGSVVDEVRIKSEPVVLERAGRPVAMLCPVDYMERNPNANHRQRALDTLENQGQNRARATDLVKWLKNARGGAR
ncbi:MAG: hypothetical protein A2498_07405 [Lentisphaerae bacterium RIFOXYC12_FULL_60_16]|nr:MAG: hypothetical protein A2498_07405 [Lentisphaerae bacterium RIFOXYC12_FULL_60_16]OGV72769.1 MAG: hypothetical protein A2269_08485 [Lentisphaerae bacterium RIFOXYA12_FULL_60_10]OGV85564.1 MAG: hypothetical protein A2340_12740 [Lentisphaerae bacterium RIFOXYB12_FULL_60_10]